MDNNKTQTERQEYLEERKFLIELENQQAKSFDKAMITLSASALAFSIAFVRDFTLKPKVECLLFVAWTGFIVALLTILLSFLFSQSALRKERNIRDIEYEEDPCKQCNFWAKATNVLNWLSIISFIVGIIFLALFVGKSLK